MHVWCPGRSKSFGSSLGHSAKHGCTFLYGRWKMSPGLLQALVHLITDQLLRKCLFNANMC